MNKINIATPAASIRPKSEDTVCHCKEKKKNGHYKLLAHFILRYSALQNKQGNINNIRRRP